MPKSLGERHEGCHQKGSLGGARANSGGDGHARHRQHCLLRAMSGAMGAENAEDGATLNKPARDPADGEDRHRRRQQPPNHPIVLGQWLRGLSGHELMEQVRHGQPSVVRRQ
jgi:hypothetical protein